MPLTHILKNKLLLQKHYNCQEISMDEWPFWMFEENIKIANELTEEENKQQKEQQKDQDSSTPNMNNMMSNIPKVGNFKIPKI